MDVIGNNIANVNTTAFKSSRVTFKDVFYQTLSDATSSTDLKGGTNASQVGYGSIVSSIDVINTRGGYQSTDRTLDLYIAGEGYYVMQDKAGNTYYTRSGNFKFDGNGGLVDSSGNYVSGWTPQYTDNRAPNPMVIPNINDYTNIAIGKDGKITGVYSGKNPDHIPNTFESKGSLKNLTITGYSNLTYANGTLSGVDGTGTTVELYKNIKIHDDGTITGDTATGTLTETVLGKVSDFATSPEDYAGWAVTDDGTIAGLYRGHFTGTVEEFGSINGPSLTVLSHTDVTFANGTLTASDGTVLYNNVTIGANGVFRGHNVATNTDEDITSIDISDFVSNPGVYQNFSLDADGMISAQYISNQVPEHVPGGIEVLGQIALATFANPDGLSQQEGVYFQETKNSGTASITYPGGNGTGSIVSGGLEMSNVDLSKEFTDMITTQRGFQANSRIITVSDEMLQELVNLKR
jgi:flagellar hook protein FlgE